MYKFHNFAKTAGGKLAGKMRSAGYSAAEVLTGNAGSITAWKTPKGLRKLEHRIAVKLGKSDGYIDSAAKMLIAVVIGLLLLVFIYGLFKNNIFPNTTSKTNSMYTYAG